MKLVCLLAAAVLTASACRGESRPKTVERPVQTLPVCQTAEDMKRLDGQTVKLVGVYRQRAIARKKARPGRPAETRPSNYVSIELRGSAASYDRHAADGEGARVRLGDEARSTDEIARLGDKPVVAIGRLVVAPPPPEEDVASEDPTPILVDIESVAAAD